MRSIVPDRLQYNIKDVLKMVVYLLYEGVSTEMMTGKTENRRKHTRRESERFRPPGGLLLSRPRGMPE